MVEAVAKTKEFLEPKANEVLKARQDLRKVLHADVCLLSESLREEGVDFWGQVFGC